MYMCNIHSVRGVKRKIREQEPQELFSPLFQDLFRLYHGICIFADDAFSHYDPRARRAVRTVQRVKIKRIRCLFAHLSSPIIIMERRGGRPHTDCTRLLTLSPFITATLPLRPWLALHYPPSLLPLRARKFIRVSVEILQIDLQEQAEEEMSIENDK